MVTIHHDRTFEYKSVKYYVLPGGPGWGYEIFRDSDGKQVADNFFKYSEIRKFLDECYQNNWDLIED